MTVIFATLVLAGVLGLMLGWSFIVSALAWGIIRNST